MSRVPAATYRSAARPPSSSAASVLDGPDSTVIVESRCAVSKARASCRITEAIESDATTVMYPFTRGRATGAACPAPPPHADAASATTATPTTVRARQPTVPPTRTTSEPTGRLSADQDRSRGGPPSLAVDGDVGRLHRRVHRAAVDEVEVGQRGRSDLGDERHRAVDPDADAISERLDAGDATRSGGGGAAGRPLGVQRGRGRMGDGEAGAGARVGHAGGATRRQPDPAAGAAPAP